VANDAAVETSVVPDVEATLLPAGDLVPREGIRSVTPGMGSSRGSSSRWKDLAPRAASAAVLAPIALACVWFGGLAFTLLIDAVTILLAVEWIGLCRHAGARWLMATGTLWIVLAAAALLWLRADPITGRANLLFLLLLIWASDIGAYLVGRLIGGPRLAPLISPGKTWSGASGGIAAALAVGWGAVWTTTGTLAWTTVIALIICVIGQLGDLTESWAKRRFGVKDSGTIIPGHGGLLDRLDALIAVAPFAALLALCLGRGVLLWE
jgi:phosphatidate cytidylyltransferase